MLNDFKQDYILRYQDILSKKAVAMKVASVEYKENMKFGDTVVRTILDLSAVRIRSFTNLADRTIDPLTDSEETMAINYQYGAVFPISRLEKIQAGPLNPAMTAGKEIAIKVANFLDAAVLLETRNGYADFDTGDLTGAGSSGVPFALNSTTVPQFVTMTKAKLETNNVSMVNTCFVIDPVSLGLIAQYPIGKDITSENTVFKNGFSGTLYGSEVYSSNNLTGEAVLTGTGTFSNGETIVIGGITFTAVSSIGATPGNFLIGADLAASLTNLTALLNDPSTTSSTQVALSSANQIKLADVLGIGSSRSSGVAVVATATTVTIVGVGSSRLSLSETAANASWTKNFVHVYYGMKGGINVAIQDQPVMEMRDEAKQLTTNIFNDCVAAVKTFSDGAQKFLDCLVSVI